MLGKRCHFRAVSCDSTMYGRPCLLGSLQVLRALGKSELCKDEDSRQVVVAGSGMGGDASLVFAKHGSRQWGCIPNLTTCR